LTIWLLYQHISNWPFGCCISIFEIGHLVVVSAYWKLATWLLYRHTGKWPFGCCIGKLQIGHLVVVSAYWKSAI
jgi:hypothetical protein